jgi:DnaJ-class molecular chaperone
MTPPDAAAGDEGVASAPADADRAACTACRGTGRVISNLGGEAHEMACPWCEGGGKFIPEHDSQAAAAEPTAS